MRTEARSPARPLPKRWGSGAGGARGRLLAALFGLAYLAAGVSHASAETLARGFRLAGDAVRTRMVLEFDREPSPRWLFLRSPHRLVLDLPDTKLALDPAAVKGRGLVRGIRYGKLDESTARVVLSARGAFTLEAVNVVKNESSPGYRMTVDVVAASEREFEEALAAQAQTTGSVAARPEESAAQAEDRFRVVVDAGHGGWDGGAKGISGAVEKDITLAFALQLRDKLAAAGFDAVLTRDEDEFLMLDERVAVARRHEADLFVSIHADTIRVPGLQGATVYTLSEKASDAEAEATAIRENLSDELAGITVEEENKEVADILIDLIRRETHGFSVRFARGLLDELSGKVGLIKNPHRSARFKVLRAPDVPSVLVELGYLSNAADEARLREAAWRARTADAVVSAVAAFAADHRAVASE